MDRHGTLLSAALVAVVLGALYGWTVAPTIAELHDTVDSAELVSVAAVLGVAHPTGEAVWLTLARGALEVVTAEEPALRTNLISVVLMALAGSLLAVAARRWRPETPWWAAAGAGLLFGLAPVVWAQAIVTEVYALQAVFATLTLVLGAGAVEGRRWRAFAFVLGLLVASHLTALALVVPLCPTAASSRAHLVRPRPALASLMAPRRSSRWWCLYWPPAGSPVLVRMRCSAAARSLGAQSRRIDPSTTVTACPPISTSSGLRTATLIWASRPISRPWEAT